MISNPQFLKLESKYRNEQIRAAYKTANYKKTHRREVMIKRLQLFKNKLRRQPVCCSV
ncbi:hypothetical protein SAMN05421736_101524 [Evansella caseinilytica]|uniref:Uncharacterized protein n=1 Tax=Evansella caseinilytica TaxID=1503961 RepID=A0A1H3HJP4_9BACI|nr:hypothetical protein [Evansella caseinilytica]SDY15773.1 hypothetical protein SAMN05421736_101524 [Evansella caseinilytica]